MRIQQQKLSLPPLPTTTLAIIINWVQMMGQILRHSEKVLQIVCRGGSKTGTGGEWSKKDARCAPGGFPARAWRANTPPSPHPSSPHLTSPHLTSPHLTSPHLTSRHVGSRHLTSPHLTSPHLTSPHPTSPHPTNDAQHNSDSQQCLPSTTLTTPTLGTPTLGTPTDRSTLKSLEA